MMNAEKILELQEKYDVLVQRAKDMQADVSSAEEELKALDERIIDAAAAERATLIQKRGALIDKVEALKAACTGLDYRRDVAFLTIYEYQEAQAAQENKNAYIRSREVVGKLQKASEALRIFRNAPGSNLTKAERDAKAVELEVAVAQFKAEAQIASRDSSRARALLERAQNGTQRIRQELNLQVA